MLFGRIDRLFGSTSFRIALVQAALLAVAFLTAGLATAFVSRGAAERDLRARILLEADGISEAIAHGGTAIGIVAVEARAERPGSLEYRLQNPNGAVLAGDLPITDVPFGWTRVRLPRGAPGAEGRERLLIFTRAMPDGSRLTLGDDISRLEGVRDDVLVSLAWIDGVALVLGLVAAFFLTRRALARMEAVQQTVAAFGRNDLTARTVVGAADGDDVDALARAVNAMLDQITHLVGDLKRVSADVAHDLRTPLAQALQKLERAKTAPPEEREATLIAAELKIKDALKLFDAMLRLAEIDAGGARARFAHVDLAEVAERMADAYRLDVEESGRAFKLDIDNCVVAGDEELIGQALANLIENAMRHTPEGAAIRIGAKFETGECVLWVVDNGPGLDAARRAEALRPFTRLDASRTTPGAGLGLAIVAAIARVHGAELALEDAEPGLRVVLRFPRANSPSAQ